MEMHQAVDWGWLAAAKHITKALPRGDAWCWRCYGSTAPQIPDWLREEGLPGVASGDCYWFAIQSVKGKPFVLGVAIGVTSEGSVVLRWAPAGEKATAFNKGLRWTPGISCWQCRYVEPAANFLPPEKMERLVRALDRTLSNANNVRIESGHNPNATIASLVPEYMFQVMTPGAVETTDGVVTTLDLYTNFKLSNTPPSDRPKIVADVITCLMGSLAAYVRAGVDHIVLDEPEPAAAVTTLPAAVTTLHLYRPKLRTEGR